MALNEQKLSPQQKSQELWPTKIVYFLSLKEILTSICLNILLQKQNDEQSNVVEWCFGFNPTFESAPFLLNQSKLFVISSENGTKERIYVCLFS